MDIPQTENIGFDARPTTDAALQANYANIIQQREYGSLLRHDTVLHSLAKKTVHAPPAAFFRENMYLRQLVDVADLLVIIVVTIFADRR